MAIRKNALLFFSFPFFRRKNITNAVAILKGRSNQIETLGTVYVDIIAPKPNANIGLVILLPISIPADILAFFLKTAIRDVVSSGNADATPRRITPKKEALIARFFTIISEFLSIMFAANAMIIKLNITIAPFLGM